MTTPKRNEAVAPVAWVGPRGDLIDNGRFQSRVDGLPDFGDLSAYLPLVHASALDALQGEVSRLREALNYIAHLDPDVDSNEGFNEWGEADCFRLARDHALTNLEPPTDGR